jgi:hypothetical protein
MAEVDVATDSLLFSLVAAELKVDDRFRNMVVDPVPYRDSASTVRDSATTARRDSVVAARRTVLELLDISALANSAQLPCVQPAPTAACTTGDSATVSLTLAETWAGKSSIRAARTAYRGVVGIHGVVTATWEGGVQRQGWHFAFLMRQDGGAWAVIDRRRYPQRAIIAKH